MKSSISKIKRVGENKLEITDSIIVNKDFIYNFDLEQKFNLTASDLVYQLSSWLILNDHQNRFKYEKKIYNTTIKVLKIIYKWNPESKINVYDGF